MEEPIRDPESARRLARAIVSDLAAYNKDELERAVVEDRVFPAMAPWIEEGRKHYESKVHPELYPRAFYEKALIDFLLKPFGRIKSRIW
jgi:hypothetical protein